MNRHLHDVFEAHLVFWRDGCTLSLDGSCVRRGQQPCCRACGCTRCGWQRKHRFSQGVEAWKCALRHAEACGLWQRVVMYVLLCRLSEEGLCLRLAMKRRQLQRSRPPIGVVRCGVNIVLNCEASGWEITSAGVLALVPIPNERSKCDIEGRRGTTG